MAFKHKANSLQWNGFAKQSQSFTMHIGFVKQSAKAESSAQRFTSWDSCAASRAMILGGS